MTTSSSIADNNKC